MNPARFLLPAIVAFSLRCGGTAVSRGTTTSAAVGETATEPAPSSRLSPASRRIVAALAAPVTITLYFSTGQPPVANADRAVLLALLAEYASVSAGRITLREVAVSTRAARDVAQRAGCEPMRLQSVDTAAETAGITELVRCVVFESSANRESIASVPVGITDMEYTVTAILHRLAAPPHTVVAGFLTGHGEAQLATEFAYLPEVLAQEQRRYAVREIDLHGGADAVPVDAEELWIVRPTAPIAARERERLDAYLAAGGSIAVIAGGVSVSGSDPTQATAAPARHGLGDWLGAYGIRWNTDLLLDPRASDGIVRVGRTTGRVRLVTWPTLTPAATDLLSTEGGLDASARLARGIQSAVMPYPSSLALDPAAARAHGGELMLLAATGPRSIRRPEGLELNIVSILQSGNQLFDHASAHGPYPVAVTYRGATRTAGAHGARMLVIASDFPFQIDALRVVAQLEGGVPGNLALLLNALDWLAGDDDMLDIPVRWAGAPNTH